jgi:hypothetical protein
MIRDFYMDVELLSAEVNIRINNQFIKKHICYEGVVYYISFDFKPVITNEEIDHCIICHDITESYCNNTAEYVLIVTTKAGFNEQTALNRAFRGSEYIILTNGPYTCLTSKNVILKQCNSGKMYYFFASLAKYSLIKVNKTCFNSGQELLDIIYEELRNISGLDDINTMITIVKSGEDYFGIMKYINKFPKSARLSKAREYINNELGLIS